MAEIYSFLMTKNIELKKVVEKDNILKRKINFIKSNILLIDKSFKFNSWLIKLSNLNQRKYY